MHTLHNSLEQEDGAEDEGGGGGGGGGCRGWPPLPPLILMAAGSCDMSIRCPLPSLPPMPAAWAACWG